MISLQSVFADYECPCFLYEKCPFSKTKTNQNNVCYCDPSDAFCISQQSLGNRNMYIRHPITDKNASLIHVSLCPCYPYPRCTANSTDPNSEPCYCNTNDIECKLDQFKANKMYVIPPLLTSNETVHFREISNRPLNKSSSGMTTKSNKKPKLSQRLLFIYSSQVNQTVNQSQNTSIVIASVSCNDNTHLCEVMKPYNSAYETVLCREPQSHCDNGYKDTLPGYSIYSCKFYFILILIILNPL